MPPIHHGPPNENSQPVANPNQQAQMAGPYNHHPPMQNQMPNMPSQMPPPSPIHSQQSQQPSAQVNNF